MSTSLYSVKFPFLTQNVLLKTSLALIRDGPNLSRSLSSLYLHHSSAFGKSWKPAKTNLSLYHISCRFYHKQLMEIRKRIYWHKPTKDHCSSPVKSGDLSGLPEVDTSLPPAHFLKSPEYQSLPDLVKRVVSLKFQPRLVMKDAQVEANVKRVKRHEYDFGSEEYQIALWTVIIRRIQNHIIRNPNDSRAKVEAKEFIDTRKKKLKTLRMMDYKRFEWVLERLDLLFQPHPLRSIRIERKESIRRLAAEYVMTMEQQKLHAFRMTLESRKGDFLRRKLDAMKSIVADELAFELKPSFTDEEIRELQKVVDLLNKEEEECKLKLETAKKEDY